MLQVGIILAISSLSKQSGQDKGRKRKQSTDTSSERRSKRKLSETDDALCIFCGKVSSEKLHEYSARNAEISLTAMAMPCLQRYLVVIWLLLRLNTIFLACQNIEINIAPTFVRKAKKWMLIMKE